MDETTDGTYELRLFVTGATPRSTRAIENLLAICDTHLKDRYRLEVIDVYQDPKVLQSEQIVAAPTLVRRTPLPTRHLVGDFSNEDRVLLGLGLRRLA